MTTVYTKYRGTPVNIFGAACADLPRTFRELPPANFGNAVVDGNTRLDRLRGSWLKRDICSRGSHNVGIAKNDRQFSTRAFLGVPKMLTRQRASCKDARIAVGVRFRFLLTIPENPIKSLDKSLTSRWSLEVLNTMSSCCCSKTRLWNRKYDNISTKMVLASTRHGPFSY